MEVIILDAKNKFTNLLKLKGLKVTKHRKSVLDVIENSSQPITAEDIYMILKQQDVSINLSSVYRILDTLVLSSIVNKFSFNDNNKTLYELNSQDHKHHLICCNCKRVFPISGCPLAKYEEQLELTMDFEITNHKLEIYGYCKECKKKGISQ